MADSENDSKNQHKKWSDEDWRLLTITFAGSLASILVGAAAIGLVVTLARVIGPGKNALSWLFLVWFTAASAGGFLIGLREKTKNWFIRIFIWFCAVIGSFGILIMIGAGAGIK